MCTGGIPGAAKHSCSFWPSPHAAETITQPAASLAFSWVRNLERVMPGPSLCQYICQHLTTPSELHCAPRSSSCCILGICQLASGNQHVPSPNLLLSGMVFGKATHVRTHPRITSIALNCCSVSFRNKVASPMVLMVATWLQILFCWTLHVQNPSCQVKSRKKMITTYWRESGS